MYIWSLYSLDSEKRFQELWCLVFYLCLKGVSVWFEQARKWAELPLKKKKKAIWNSPWQAAFSMKNPPFFEVLNISRWTFSIYWLQNGIMTSFSNMKNYKRKLLVKLNHTHSLLRQNEELKAWESKREKNFSYIGNHSHSVNHVLKGS